MLEDGNSSKKSKSTILLNASLGSLQREFADTARKVGNNEDSHPQQNPIGRCCEIREKKSRLKLLRRVEMTWEARTHPCPVRRQHDILLNPHYPEAAPNLDRIGTETGLQKPPKSGHPGL